jgi:hypothetical protein
MLWLIPILLTVFVWALFNRYSSRRRRCGDYDFGIDVIIMFGGAVAATLLIWLLFFVALWLFR